MLSELALELASLGLKIDQEDRVNRLIQIRTDQLIDILDFSAEARKALKDLSAR